MSRHAGNSDTPGMDEPCALAAEQAIIGLIAKDSTALHEAVAAGLEGPHFGCHAIRYLFSAALNLSERSETIDALALADEAMRLPGAPDIGPTVMHEVADGAYRKAVEIYDVGQHVATVRGMYFRRQAIDAGRVMVAQLCDVSTDANATMDRALDAIGRQRIATNRKPMEDDVGALVKARVAEIKTGKPSTPAVATGYEAFDTLTGGFRRGSLNIIAAPPGRGKSSLVLHMAMRMSVGESQPVPYFSLEMLTEDNINRLIAQISDTDTMVVHRGEFEEYQHTKLNRVVEFAHKAKIKFDRTGARTIPAMRAVCKLYVAKHGQLAAIVVDFVQLVQGIGESREREVASVSNGLKGMAMDFACPVLALSSMNRAGQAIGTRPTLAALRDSGQIESDADMVMFLYNDKPPEMGGKDYVEWIIEKNRGGGTGSLMSEFKRASTRFDDNVRLIDTPGPMSRPATRPKWRR